MKKTFAAIIVALALGAGIVVAQDAIFAFRGAFADTVISQPCGANGLKGAASMTVYDKSAWIVYTCNDDRVVLRRYFNPNDNAVPMAPGVVECTVPGLYTSKFGGCVDWNHPDRRR